MRRGACGRITCQLPISFGQRGGCTTMRGKGGVHVVESYMHTSFGFQFGHVARTEEKLTVEIAFLNGVHVSNGDAASLAGQTNHSHVLQQLYRVVV